jgi:putative ABC transport system permease protein
VSAGWCWARADLKRRWPSAVALAVLVAFAFGATTALVAGARRANSAAVRYTETSDLADVTVFLGGEPTADLLEALTTDPRITRTQRSDLAVITPDPAVPGNDGFMAIGRDGSVTGGFGTPPLLSGRYPEPGATDEVLANERGAIEFGLRAGDRTTVSGISCFECEPTRLPGEVTITGIVRVVNDLVDDPAVVGLFLAPPNFLDGAWRSQARPGTIYWIYLADHADALAVSQELSGLVADGDVSSNVASLEVVNRSGDVQGNALFVAAGVVGLVGLLVLGHAMARFVSVRQRDEGILAALGLTRGERAGAAFGLMTPAVVVGAVGAVLVAIGLSPLFPAGLSRRADPDAGLHADTVVLALGALGSIVASGTVALIVARRWVVQNARRAARPAGATTRLAALGMPPVPLAGVRFALERAGGPSRPPTRSTVAAIVTAMAVVAGALVMQSSIDGLQADPSRYGQAWALTVAGGDDLHTLASQVAQDPRVVAVDLASQGELNLTTESGTTAQVATLGVEGFADPPQITMLAGRAPLAPGEIALGTVTMRDLDVGIGAELVASGPCGARRLHVTGRVILPLVGSDTPDEGGVLTLDEYDELCAAQLIADIDQNRGLLVRLRDDAQTDAVAEDLSAQGFFVDRASRPSSVAALVDLRSVTALVAAIVGALGLAVAAYALMLSVRRRRGELAVLRALGLRPGQASEVLSAQAATLATLALVLGLPMGVVVGRILWSVIAEPSNVLVRVDIGSAVGVAGATMAILILTISLWPGWRARRIDVAGALRSE